MLREALRVRGETLSEFYYSMFEEWSVLSVKVVASKVLV